MKPYLAILLLAVLVLLRPPLAMADGFLSLVDDLPLAPGLSELPGQGMAFDSPSGRIGEALARGAVAPQAVTAFYAETLPQLGWGAAGAGRWRRESELLRITIETRERQTLVRFQVSPD